LRFLSRKNITHPEKLHWKKSSLVTQNKGHTLHHLDNPNLQEVGRKEDEICPTPTIVNGVTNMNSISKYKQQRSSVPNDSFNHLINNLCETINECNKREHSSSKKHRIILIGNSHVKGFAGSLKSVLNSDYDLFSVVKP
jgi:hypothetical protein